MAATALALVIGAAILHAAWNALAKQGRDQIAFLWSSVSLATLLILPGAVWELSALIGRLWLGEKGLGARLAGAGVVLAAVACVALAK